MRRVGGGGGLLYMNLEFELVYICRFTRKYYVLPKNKCKFIESHLQFHFL